MTRGGKRKQSSFGMDNNKDQNGKNPRKHPYEYELTEEDKQKIQDIVEQVYAQESKRLRPSSSRGPWDWYPTTLAVWAREERVPKLPLLEILHKMKRIETSSVAEDFCSTEVPLNRFRATQVNPTVSQGTTAEAVCTAGVNRKPEMLPETRVFSSSTRNRSL
ncbi:hypothetical protein E3N88_04960 [Mikania micrantha]|uniref:Uncharacterized protein n=1 Tax=Mikania micrantha TaxID=192012 RepID=A0A5N6PWE9_9ASTR|nr:hypothetical protein E3N88_04960 [Mikania micrantha]